jgi:hypothetical protein
MVMATTFLVVFNLAQDLDPALDVCDSRAVAAVHCLLIMSWNEACILKTTHIKTCK